MRACVIAAMIAGCSSTTGGGTHGTGPCHYQDHDYAIGETWPAGDDCNDCSCTATGITCTARPCHAPFDANPATACQRNDTCDVGVGCGAICCGAGEHCDFGACHCGAGSACGSGDTCESAGPAGGDACGTVCCGATGPCPN